MVTYHVKLRDKFTLEDESTTSIKKARLIACSAIRKSKYTTQAMIVTMNRKGGTYLNVIEDVWRDAKGKQYFTQVAEPHNNTFSWGRINTKTGEVEWVN